MLGLVGVFSTPHHIIVYLHGDRVNEVRQPVNICLRARVVGDEIRPEPAKTREVRWVVPDDVDDCRIHPAIRLRIDRGLEDGEPYIG